MGWGFYNFLIFFTFFKGFLLNTNMILWTMYPKEERNKETKKEGNKKTWGEEGRGKGKGTKERKQKQITKTESKNKKPKNINKKKKERRKSKNKSQDTLLALDH